MFKRLAAGAAVACFSLGVVAVSPATADPDDKAAKEFAHEFCASEFGQQFAVFILGAEKANRGQCMKAVRAAFEDAGGAA